MQTIKQMKTETLWKINDLEGIDRKSKLMIQVEIVRRGHTKRIAKATATILGDHTVFQKKNGPRARYAEAIPGESTTT